MGTNEPIVKESMSSIGGRLREERERLGMNQTSFAELAGTTRKTQFNYESDVRRPDADYLAAIAAVGVDVLYVLTGSKPSQVKAPVLSDEHRELIENYDGSSTNDRAAIRQLAKSVSRPRPTTTAPSDGRKSSSK